MVGLQPFPFFFPAAFGHVRNVEEHPLASIGLTLAQIFGQPLQQVFALKRQTDTVAKFQIFKSRKDISIPVNDFIEYIQILQFVILTKPNVIGKVLSN